MSSAENIKFHENFCLVLNLKKSLKFVSQIAQFYVKNTCKMKNHFSPPSLTPKLYNYELTHLSLSLNRSKKTMKYFLKIAQEENTKIKAYGSMI
jgi:hypothetical protein